MKDFSKLCVHTSCPVTRISQSPHTFSHPCNLTAFLQQQASSQLNNPLCMSTSLSHTPRALSWKPVSHGGTLQGLFGHCQQPFESQRAPMQTSHVPFLHLYFTHRCLMLKYTEITFTDKPETEAFLKGK